MNVKAISLCCIVVAMLSGCASSAKVKKGRSYDCTLRVSQAISKYSKNRFGDVQSIIEDVKYQCSGHSVMDTALYYLSMSYFRTKKYVEAKAQFERLARDYPNSVFADEAQYRAAMSLYKQSNPSDRDQMETRDAIRLLVDFSESNPESNYADSARIYATEGREKLALKEFNNARFYEKVNQSEAAVVYYKVLIQQYPDSKYAPTAMLNMAEILLKLNRYDEARTILDELEGNEKNSEIMKKVKALRSKLK
jgi:outer membrane protein assembly factor BamD